MKINSQKFKKECEGLNFLEWPQEWQKKLLDEVVKDFQKEKLKSLKRPNALSLRDK
ncbi:hypothetical protein K0B04_03680 [Patescibacteria group bacterium]|nr:hypothetical protein [Patescibacteria group bacterium]